MKVDFSPWDHALENVLRAALETETTGSRMANPDDKINQLYITLNYARCSGLPFELSGKTVSIRSSNEISLI